MAERRIDILISSKSNNAGIKDAEAGLKGLDQTASKLSGGLGGLADIAGVAGFLGLATGIAGVTVELSKAAAESERTRSSFDLLASQAGESGDQMLAALRSASGGMVSNADLVLSANRAMLLGVADSSDQMAQLLQVATARGRAMGLSTQQAFSDLVTGIGRMSPLILDNLGIVTGGAKVFDSYAASIGTTADKLSDAERKQALFSAVVSSSAGIVAGASATANDTAGSYERLAAAWDNLKNSAGEAVNSSGLLAGSINATATALDNVAQHGPAGIFEEWAKAIDMIGAKVGVATNLSAGFVAAENASAGAADSAAAAAHQAAQAAQEKANADARAKAETDQFNASLAAAPAVFQHWAASARAAGESVDELRRVMSSAKAEFGQLQSARDATVSGLAQAAARNNQFIGPDQSYKLYLDGVKQVDRQVEVLTNRLANGTITSEEFAYQLAFVGQNATGAFDQLEADRRVTEKWATSAGTDLNQAFDDLKGKVSSVLGEALNVDVGFNPDDILPREDAINEPARRLADIAVNGYKSPWVEYFKSEFPGLFQQFFAGAAGDDGIKQNAAQLMRNFQDGLVPELLDKDKAKERVRKMLLGEQNMAALAQEIATELSGEFGNVAPADIQAIASQALGGRSTDTKATNAALGAGLVEGVSGAGNQAIQAVAAELKSENNLKLIGDAGRSGGSMWGKGFLETVGSSVPQQLIEILATLVTPLVQGNLSQQASLQGAN